MTSSQIFWTSEIPIINLLSGPALQRHKPEHSDIQLIEICRKPFENLKLDFPQAFYYSTVSFHTFRGDCDR